jgi:zinc protease
MKRHHAWLIGRTDFVMACLTAVLALGRATGGIDETVVSTQPAGADANRPYQVVQERDDRMIVELPNRLMVIAQELHSAPVVSVQVWVKTGSIYEGEYVGAGLSHFLEHLIAGGTTSTRTEEESNTILGRIGAETNAATSLDNVHYYINTTAAFSEQAIELMSDWMQNSLIPEKEYDRERSVIQREFEMGEGEPSRILWKLTLQARYALHPARHPTIGYLDEFLKVSRDQIEDFYHRMYVPNNMIFVVAGDIDRRRAVEQISRLWSGVGAKLLPEVGFPVEVQPAGERETSGTAGIDKPTLRLAWPGTRLAEEGDYALDLLGVILGQGDAGRLQRTVRDEQRAVDGIHSYNLSFDWGEGFFGIDAEIAEPEIAAGENTPVKITPIARAKSAILEQVDKLRAEEVTAQELARAKRTILAGTVMQAQSAEAVANRLASDLISTGDPDYLSRYGEAIQSVTAGQVLAAAKKHLDPSKLISITLRPTSDEQPSTPLTRPATPENVLVIGRERRWLDNLALRESMDRSTRDDSRSVPAMTVDAPITRTFANGLRVIVGRNTIVPAVAIQVYQRGGLLTDAPGREGVAYATDAMRVHGTTTRTGDRIAEEIEGLGASLDTDCGNNTSYTRAACLKEDWRGVLGIVADVTLNPTFSEEEWGKVKPLVLAKIDRQTDSWSAELNLRFREQYFKDHPWSRQPAGRREVTESLTSDDLRAFHREHLNAGESVLAVFGDVDPEQVFQEAERLFAAMPSAPGGTAQLPEPTVPTPTVVQLQTNKRLAAVQIGLGPGVARRDPDFAVLQVLASVMSSFPSGWLEEELRGRGPGLAYVVSAGQFTGAVPGYFGVLFNTNSETVPLALNRTVTVIDRARTELVDEQTLSRAKARVLTDEFSNKQSNENRAADAALNELYGLGPDESAHYQSQVRQITAEQIRDAARKHLQNPVVVVLTYKPIPQEDLDQTIMLPADEEETPGATTQPASPNDSHERQENNGQATTKPRRDTPDEAKSSR